MDNTKLTPARILVMFVVLGAILGAFGLYDKLIDIGGAGASVPLPSFGNSLAKAAIKGVKEDGLLGAFTGGIEGADQGHREGYQGCGSTAEGRCRLLRPDPRYCQEAEIPAQ